MILFLKNLLFTLIVPGVVVVWVPFHLFERQAEWPATGFSWHHWLGSVLVLPCVALYLHCVWLFATYGRGTPAPIDPPKKLVQRGAYRWVRNPMYLAVLALVGAEAVFFTSWHIAIYLLCLSCLFQLFVVLHEESALSFDYGAMYEDYKRAVPRWWPRRPQPRD